MPQGCESGPCCFHLVLIKPSHYDDDGYPIQWVKAAIPSNTLACLNALAEDAGVAGCSGPTSTIRLHTLTRPIGGSGPIASSARSVEQGGGALIALVGVQSNQFPRAVDLARPFLAAGLPVCIGGFHVSGCIAMLPEMPPEMREAQALGISFFAGEAEEGRLDEVLRDACDGHAASRSTTSWTICRRSKASRRRCCRHATSGGPPARCRASISGRGCPYQCSFCTIINVQGRKSRFRTPDDLERTIRENYAQGIKRFFITDDNFARNRHWEALFDRMIRLRRARG